MTTDITVKDLEKLIADSFEAKSEYELAKAEAAGLYAKLEDIKSKIIGTLESLEMHTYKSEAGTFSYKPVSSFTTPKTDEDKAAFYSYLRERGVFEGLISVNSRTLNSWAHLEEEMAEKAGNFDYQIPGLRKTDPVMKATMTKARKK